MACCQRIVLVLSTTLLLAVSGCMRPNLPSLRSSGMAAYESGDYVTAQNAFATVLEEKPEDPEAHLWMGRSLLESGHPLPARTHLEVAYQRYWASGNFGREIALDLARAMGESGDRSRGFEFLQERATSSGNVQDYLLWGDFAAQHGDPDMAELAYRTGARLDAGRSVTPYLRLADFYEALGDTDSASIALRQAYGIDPTNDAISDRLGTYVGVVGPSVALPPDR